MIAAPAGGLAAVGPSAWWYLNRSTGVVSLVLLTASVVLGIVEQQRWQPNGWPRFVLHRLHRNISLTAMVFLAIHVLASVIDSFAPIVLIDAVVPFQSAYRPIWLGFGALAFDLLLAIVISSALRKRIGQQAWRRVHWLTYVSWPIAVVHGLGTGTDAKQVWMLALTTLCVIAVLVAAWLRVMSVPRRLEGRRMAAYAALTLGPMLLIVWLPLGPLGSGWALRAGTPPALLGLPGGSTALSRQAEFQAGFSEPLEGTIRQQRDHGKVVVDLGMRFGDSPAGVASIHLTGRSTSGGHGLHSRSGRSRPCVEAVPLHGIGQVDPRRRHPRDGGRLLGALAQPVDHREDRGPGDQRDHRGATVDAQRVLGSEATRCRSVWRTIRPTSSGSRATRRAVNRSTRWPASRSRASRSRSFSNAALELWNW